MSFQLQLFGPVSLHLDGAIEHNVRRKSLALLAYLITEDRSLARDHLADLFWPDLPLNKAKRNLSWSLSNLAAHLPTCLHITSQRVRYVGHADLVVDTVQAGAWLHQHELQVQRQALDVMHGPFMDGFTLNGLAELETWHLAQQEIWRRRQQQQRLFVQVIDGLCAAYEDETAVVYALRWVQIFPWDEEAHRAVMSCLAASGRPDLALDHFAECRRILRAEVDLDPSPETESLYREIQAQQAAATGAQQAPPHLPSFLTPLIGRDGELDRLTRRLKAPNYRLVALVGAGGSGKTRLAVAAAEKLRADFGDYAASCVWAEEGEALSRQLNDPETLSRHLVLKGRALCALGRYAAAPPYLRETVDLTVRLGVKMHILFSLYALVRGILDGPTPRPMADIVLWPKLVQLAAHVAQNPFTLPSTAQRAQTLLARLLTAAPDAVSYVETGQNCSLEEAVQVGYQVIEFLKE
ncbi:hypothetical protein GC175_25660 [bacterium]|nr:hypothetical protein [bacterium]